MINQGALFLSLIFVFHFSEINLWLAKKVLTLGSHEISSLGTEEKKYIFNSPEAASINRVAKWFSITFLIIFQE